MSNVGSMAIAPQRRRHERGASTRRALLDAALHEFAASGFDATSTRAIAARAGVRQGQLTYHFESKSALWRAAVDHLFDRFDLEFGSALEPTDDDPAAAFAADVRALVRTVSRLPELNRIMVHESTSDSDRLTWIVDSHVRRRFRRIASQWDEARAAGATTIDVDPLVVYYSVVGAASLLYVNAPEARLLAGRDVITDDLITAHADALVAMLLTPPPPPPGNPQEDD